MRCTIDRSYILHPDGCRCQWAWSRMRNDPCHVFSDAAGSNHSGHGYLPARMQYVHCISFCTVQNPAGYGGGNAGHHGF